MTDVHGHSVRVFSDTGTLLAECGSNKNGDFELDSPSGIAIERAGNVFVSNTDEDQIKKFAPA